MCWTRPLISGLCKAGIGPPWAKCTGDSPCFLSHLSAAPSPSQMHPMLTPGNHWLSHCPVPFCHGASCSKGFYPKAEFPWEFGWTCQVGAADKWPMAGQPLQSHVLSAAASFPAAALGPTDWEFHPSALTLQWTPTIRELLSPS